MNWRTVRTIFGKELLDTVRDRRTVIAMIVVPIVLYPTLIIATSQIAMVQQSRIEKTASRVAIEGPGGPVLREWLSSNDRIELVETQQARIDIESGQIDAIVSADRPLAALEAANDSASVVITFDITESKSRQAADRVEGVLAKKRDSLLVGRLERNGLPATFSRPLEWKRDNVAPPEKSTGALLGSILPLLLVVTLGIGAFYPAVDLTAGEKERGTFETLLSTPTSKLEIVWGKFLAVFSLAMITGLLNLASMAGALIFQIRQLAGTSREAGQVFNIDLSSIPPIAIVAALVLLVPLAFFISAMMMTVALFARSFKEAQNFVTPVFLFIVLPASITTLPDFELTTATQFLPIGNVSLLFREMMSGAATLDQFFVVLLCTCVYAAFALVIASWVFQREEVILNEERGIPLTLRRSQFIPRDHPTPGQALGMFTVVMLLIFYLATYFQGRDLISGLIITEYGLILVPVAVWLWYTRVDLRAALHLAMPNTLSLVGTLLIAPAWVILSLQLGIWWNEVLPFPKEFAEVMEKALGLNPDANVLWLLFVIALSPAICEEALFRGPLISAFRGRLPNWLIVFGGGAAFGVFHLSIYRVFPTAMTGFVFTWLVLQTRSIVTSAIAHLILNGTIILVATQHLPDFILTYLRDADTEGIPTWLLGGAAALFVAGVLLVMRGARGQGSSGRGLTGLDSVG